MLITVQLLFNLPITPAIVAGLIVARVVSSCHVAAHDGRRLSLLVWTGLSVVSLISIAVAVVQLRKLLASGDPRFVSSAILFFGALVGAWFVADSMADRATGAA